MNDATFDLLGLGHVAVGGAFLIYAYFRIRHLKRATLLHFSSVFFIACTCLFSPLIKYQYPEWVIIDRVASQRSLAASAMFIVGCIAADLCFYRRQGGGHQTRLLPTGTSDFVLVAVFAFGLVGFLRYFFIGRAVDHLGEVFSLVSSGAEYYQSRIAVADDLQRSTGLGVVHAQIAVSGVFPVVIGFCLLMARYRWKLFYWGPAFMAYLLSALIVSITLQRQAVLFACLIPVLMWALLRTPLLVERRILWLAEWRGMAIVFLVLVAGGTAAYAWTDSQSSRSPIGQSFGRVFLMPNMVGTWYYDAFPERFHFRGWSHLFFMSGDLGGSDTSTRDIAEFVTRFYTMNANSHFLATAYSGAGLLGCLVVIMIFLGVVVTADWMFARVAPEFRALNILVNLGGLISLPNAPLGVAFTSSGFAYPSLILWILLKTCRRDRPTLPNQDNRTQEGIPLVPSTGACRRVDSSRVTERPWQGSSRSDTLTGGLNS